MTSTYKLSSVDDIILNGISTDKSFLEFSKDVYTLELISESLVFFEDVKDTTVDLKNVGKNIKKNTIDTTRDVAGVYGDITDANANLIKSTWDIFARAVGLISRASAYIINKISSIPKMILRVADRASYIPSEIKAKIQGDITLYISANDISKVYNELFMRNLTHYIHLASELSKGEFFSTFFKRKHSKEEPIIQSNDMKTCKEMDKIYEHLQNTEFTPRVIKMTNEDIVDIYFSDKKSVKFTDVYGKVREASYFEALNTLIKDLESKTDELKNVQKSVGNKLLTTEANSTYNELSSRSKYRVNNTISQISKVISIVGNFMKYIMTDLNTINNSIDKILHTQSSIPKVDGMKAATTPETKVNTKV